MRSILVALSALAFAACATPTGPAAYDAFDSYEGQRADLSGYDGVFIAPITASQAILDRIDANPIGPTRRIRPISARDLEDQQDELAEAMTRALSEVASVRDAPGPGVLTIEAELTELQANRPTQAELAATPSLDFRSISVGDAGVRITLSEAGRRIGVIDDRAIRQNLNDPTIGVSIWGTADRYFDRVSNKLAALMREPAA